MNYRDKPTAHRPPPTAHRPPTTDLSAVALAKEDMPADKWADRAESALPTAHHVGQSPLRDRPSDYGLSNLARFQESWHISIMKLNQLLGRITFDPDIFSGKPIIRGHRIAVEHILDMLAAGDDSATILAGYPWLEAEDIQACLVYASRLARHERIELFPSVLAS